MGAYKLLSSHNCDRNCRSPSYGSYDYYEPASAKSTDPNPKEFTIIEDFDYDNASVFFVKYKGCTNYEGNKVLVFSKKALAVTKDIIRDGNTLDPHFLEGSALIARFAPTDDGLLYARELAEKL